jgi:hypothetical protein
LKKGRFVLNLRRCAAGVVVFAAFSLVAATSAFAATISGTVSEADGAHAVLEGVEVCSHVQPYTFEDSCATSDGAGNYSLSVPAGSYSVHFSDSPRNRNLVDQYYGGSVTFPGTLVSVSGATESVTGIDAQLGEGSTISGSVTDAATHASIAGIPVCAVAEYGLEGFATRCHKTDESGNYAINGLPPGEYEVEFQSGLLNYQPQYYDGTPERAGRTLVPILAAGETAGSIDAAMEVGVEITGTLTEAGTGVPLGGILVDALQAHREGNWQTHTDAGGNYAFRGLPGGEFIVVFSKPQGPSDSDCYSTQFYAGSSELAGATVLFASPETPLTGINGQVTHECLPPPTPLASLPAVATQPKTRTPLRCKRGFQRRQVKGKVRCVRRAKARRKHHRHAPVRQHDAR